MMDGQSVEVPRPNDGLSVVTSLSEVSEQIDIAEDIPTDNDSNSDVFHHSEENTNTDHDVQSSNVTLSFTTSQALHTTSDSLSPQTVHIEVTPAQAAVLTAIQHETGGTSTPTHVLVTTTTPLHSSGLQESHSQLRLQGVQEQLAEHELKQEDSEAGSPSTPCSEGHLTEARSKWAETALGSDVLLVRCRNETAELYKSKLGSGGRGKCIKMGDQWFTPTEYEAYCGRASSKDWKRSIRYGGRTLQTLIEESILTPHAISCTCATCCDDDTLAGPVRLFVPYKRRKRESVSGESPLIKRRNMSVSSPLSGVQQAAATMMRSMSVDSAVHPQVTVPSDDDCMDTELQQSGLVVNTTSVSSAMPITSTHLSTVVSPVSVNNTMHAENMLDQRRHWWHIEEVGAAMHVMVNSLLSTAQQLKAMIEQAKLQSEASRDAAVAQAKLQAEAEKKEALAEARMKSLMQLSRALMEARAEKEAAVAQALAQAKADKMEAVAEAKTQQFLKETSGMTMNHEDGQSEL